MPDEFLRKKAFYHSKLWFIVTIKKGGSREETLKMLIYTVALGIVTVK